MTDDDNSLFRQAIKGVQPLASDNRDHHSSRPHAAKPRLRQHPSQADLLHEQFLLEEKAEVPETALEYRRPGLQDRVMRRLRSGKTPREDSLDLHGMSQDEARRALASFLAKSQQHGLRCVRIIHGKGLRSGDRGPVLKRSLGQWLRNQPFVLGMCQAQRSEGGSGAVIVLLRTPSKL